MYNRSERGGEMHDILRRYEEASKRRSHFCREHEERKALVAKRKRELRVVVKVFKREG